MVKCFVLKKRKERWSSFREGNFYE